MLVRPTWIALSALLLTACSSSSSGRESGNTQADTGPKIQYDASNTYLGDALWLTDVPEPEVKGSEADPDTGSPQVEDVPVTPIADVPTPEDIAPEVEPIIDVGPVIDYPQNTFAAGQSFTLTIEPGTLKSGQLGVGPGCPTCALEDARLLVTVFHDDDGLLSAWFDLQGSTDGPRRGTTSEILDGDALMLSSDAGLGAPGKCDGWWLTVDNLMVAGEDRDFDGTPDLLWGTLDGEYHELHGDYEDASWITANVVGTVDGEPPVLAVEAEGEWPELRVRVTASELVAQTGVKAALTHEVDGIPSPATLSPARIGPSGTGRVFTVEPSEPYLPGAKVKVTVAPLDDLAGNTSDGEESTTVKIPPQPVTTLAGETDFSDGDPFTEGLDTEITSKFDGLSAPTGGAMAVLAVDVGAPKQMALAGLHIPDGATTLVVEAAAAWPKSSYVGLSFQVAVLEPGGTHGTPLLPPFSDDSLEHGGITYSFGGFSPYELPVGALAGKNVVLVVGTLSSDPMPECIALPPPEGKGYYLIDRIGFE